MFDAPSVHCCCGTFGGLRDNTDERQTYLRTLFTKLKVRKCYVIVPYWMPEGESQAVTTMTKSDAPLSLDQCVQTIKQHLSSAPNAPPKELARLYLAAVGLACFIKADQKTLHEARYEYGIILFREMDLK
jgi:hypothetical protein